jgi:hypothetical protein
MAHEDLSENQPGSVNTTFPRPEKPSHPIIQFDDDGLSLTTCIDVVNRVSCFLDLINYIDVGGDDETDCGGGLAPDADRAYKDMISTLYQSLRFVSESMNLNDYLDFTKKKTQPRQTLDGLNRVSDQLQGLIDQSEAANDAIQTNTEKDINTQSEAANDVSHFPNHLTQQLRSVKTLLNDLTTPFIEERNQAPDSNE